MNLTLLAWPLAALLSSPLAVAAPAAAVQDAYARPHTRVDVGDGRKMNLYCLGQGSPTVVFESGSGMAAWDWLLVHPAVARKTRACVYDRAGLGFSDPSPRPPTSANAVDDLHRLLVAAAVRPPYVLVGHSFGGTNVQLFAYTYPQEVAGLVNVDGAHEDESRRLNEITNGLFDQLNAQSAEQEKACVAEAERGWRPGSEAQATCVGTPPPVFKGALAKAWLASRSRAAYWRAGQAEGENDAANDALLRQVRRPFGDLPFVYLTHGISPYQPPGKPQSELNKATETEIRALHAQVAALSTRGRHRVVPGAGHTIQMDRPQAVIDATLEVLAEARAAR